MTPRPEVSVIVATHNGRRHLPDSLPPLLPGSQTLAASRYEVIVIDNASTDDTGDLARELGQGASNFRVIEEPEPGLCHARNRGIREARGEVIAFIDDDAAAQPGWLLSIARLFEEQPEAWSAGGPIDIRWMSARPAWWTPGLDEIFNRHDRGPRRHRIYYPKVPIGTNMAFRKTAFAAVGMFDTAFGRKGSSLRAGEESDLGLRIQRAGGHLYYEPGMRIEHFAYAARLSPGFARRRADMHARSRCRIDWQHLGLRRVPHQLVRVMLGALRVALHHRLGVEEQLPFIYFRGYFAELWQVFREG